MRILHTSDWHLGKVIFERSLLEDQAHALDLLLGHLVTDPHDVLIVAGDIFDRSIPPEEAVRLLGTWLQKLRAALPSLPVVLIAGNHDSATRLAWASGLLSGMGLHLRGGPDDLKRPIELRLPSGEEAQIWAVPFLWAGDVATEDEHPSQAGALRAALAEVRPLQRAGAAQVLVAHCFAQGGAVSDSERTLLGQATQIAPSLFEGFDYVALGHLHRPQKVGANARYSGSLFPYSFSEAGDEKCALSVTVRPGAPHVAATLPLPPRKRLRVLEGTLEELLTDARFADAVDDYVCARLSKGSSASPMTQLRSRFAHVLQLINPMEDLASGGLAPRALTEDATDLAADATSFLGQLRADPPTPATLATLATLCSNLPEHVGPLAGPLTPARSTETA